MSDSESIKAKFREALPHFRHAMRKAVEEAGPNGFVGIGIIAIPDGKESGRIVARFEAAEFFEDLAVVIDALPETEEDKLGAIAVSILHQFTPRSQS